MPEKDIPASDWTEQDLLTRDLARERLAEAESEALAELHALRAAPAADPAAVDLLERRLEAIATTRALIGG